MNGRKARALRQKARSLTVGFPKAEYTVDSNGAVVLATNCTKGVYRQLKKEYLNKHRTTRGQR